MEVASINIRHLTKVMKDRLRIQEIRIKIIKPLLSTHPEGIMHLLILIYIVTALIYLGLVDTIRNLPLRLEEVPLQHLVTVVHLHQRLDMVLRIYL